MTDNEEDIPIETIRKELRLSRVEFLDFLNDDSSGNRLVTSMEEEFREHLDKLELKGKAGAKYFSGFSLSSVTVERIDWERWQEKQQDFTEREKWKHSLNIVDDGFSFLKEFYSEQSEKIAKLSNDIRNKNRHIDYLEQEIQKMQSHGTTGCDGCGHLSRICRMRRNGTSEEELANFLYNSGDWFSYAQIGALLHTEETKVAQESMGQRARRLLGKIS